MSMINKKLSILSDKLYAKSNEVAGEKVKEWIVFNELFGVFLERVAHKL